MAFESRDGVNLVVEVLYAVAFESRDGVNLVVEVFYAVDVESRDGVNLAVEVLYAAAFESRDGVNLVVEASTQNRNQPKRQPSKTAITQNGRESTLDLRHWGKIPIWLKFSCTGWHKTAFRGNAVFLLTIPMIPS